VEAVGAVAQQVLVVLAMAGEAAVAARHLKLGERGKRVPLVGGAAGGGDVAEGDLLAAEDAALQRPREVDAVRLRRRDEEARQRGAQERSGAAAAARRRRRRGGGGGGGGARTRTCRQ